MSTLAFVDTETTHLDPRFGDAWEIAVIRREQDGTETEHLWQVRVPLEQADMVALEVGSYYERFAVPDGWDAIQLLPELPPLRLTLSEMLFDFQEAVADGVLVGSNPGFDDRFLRKLLAAHARRVPWHYRPIDIATYAAGFVRGGLGEHDGELVMPWSSRTLSRAVGVEPPGVGVAHTALGDARWARDVYDTVTAGRTTCSDPWAQGGHA